MARARWRREHEARERGEFAGCESFEDALARAKADRKGQLIREGRSYSAAAVNHWQLRWSLRGYCNQFDLLFNRAVVFTGGSRRLRRLAPWLRI
jgi:hypothetical protein